MLLSELAAYAKEKYGIEEEHKWADFPGFSVLCHPDTGKWAALFMRHWDSDSGSAIERCDLKCGEHTLFEIRKPYVSRPFRMHGQKWVGITFDRETEPDTVFQLFDRAIVSGNISGYTIVLDENPYSGTYTNTAVKTSGRSANGESSKASSKVFGDTLLPFSGKITKGFPTDYTRKAQRPQRPTISDVPERLLEMMDLYEYGSGTLAHKARNFYRQGKFMEDYEDNAPWRGTFQRYFTTYHDLNVRQLRGYFTWRTYVRRGEYQAITTSLAYVYIYELLCGIGTSSPEDTLDKMKAFEKGYIDSGIGDQGMQRNLQRWSLEYAVLHNLPSKRVMQYIDQDIIEHDQSLTVLKCPDNHTDTEIFDALCFFAGKKLKGSPVLKKDQDKGQYLFAEVWRCLSRDYKVDGKDIFTVCFGRQKSFPWHPLSNAVYYEEMSLQDRDYFLNECRSYHLRDGAWQEKRYEKLYFNMDMLRAIIHESDRFLRKSLKTGHYLHKKESEGWVSPYVEAVLEAERLAETEAAKPKINIDFSGLERIRQDAMDTRDSLLLDEDKEESFFAAESGKESFSANEIVIEKPGLEAEEWEGLDHLHMEILIDLLQGKPVEERMKAELLMPSVVTDTINEALFDEIGDNILECDGDRISVVEDYREDILEVLEIPI